MVERNWLLLAERINRALNVEKYEAVIVTHGTDTMEESAFALQSLVKSNKPVIMIGASRPGDHPQPDGPTNIRHAVRVAIDSRAENRGVMVVMGGKITPAFDITEFRSMLVTKELKERFHSPNFGSLGEITNDNQILWNDRH